MLRALLKVKLEIECKFKKVNTLIINLVSRPEIGLQIKSVNDEKDPIRTVVPRSRGIGVKF